MPDLAASTSKNKVIWPKRMSLLLIRFRYMVVCQRTKKWNCGSIHRITWMTLWIFKFFIRYYGEFTFYSYSVDLPILSYGQIFRMSDFFGWGGNLIPAGNLLHCCKTYSVSIDQDPKEMHRSLREVPPHRTILVLVKVS
jgi:hypothetical protein